LLSFFSACALAVFTFYSLFGVSPEEVIEEPLAIVDSIVDYSQEEEIINGDVVTTTTRVIFGNTDVEMPALSFDHMPEFLHSSTTLVGAAHSDWFFGSPPTILLQTSGGVLITTGILDVERSLVEGEEASFSVVFTFDRPSDSLGLIRIEKKHELTGEQLVFTQPVQFDVGQKAPSFRLFSPDDDTYIESPLTFSGEAVAWYFEGSFPVTLYDSNGNIIAQSYARALDDWMSYEFVPFEGNISFDTPSTATGTLTFSEDNSGDLSESEVEKVVVPVRFR